jgi:hypothetical protein
MTGCEDHDRGIDHLPAVCPEDQLGLCCLREPVQGRCRDMVDLYMPRAWTRKWSKICCWNGFSPRERSIHTWNSTFALYDMLWLDFSLVNLRHGSRMMMRLYCFFLSIWSSGQGCSFQCHSTCHGCPLCSRVWLTLFYFCYQNVQLYCCYNQHLSVLWFCIVLFMSPACARPEITTKSAAAASPAPWQEGTVFEYRYGQSTTVEKLLNVFGLKLKSLDFISDVKWSEVWQRKWDMKTKNKVQMLKSLDWLLGKWRINGRFLCITSRLNENGVLWSPSWITPQRERGSC